MMMKCPEQQPLIPVNQRRTFLFWGLMVFSLVLTAQPVITSFTPVSGNIGSTVTINGTGFNSTPADNIVFMGHVKAPVTAATATSLSVTVPGAATYQPLTITTGGLSGSSLLPFNVTLTGVVNAFTATSYSAPIDFNTSLGLYDIILADMDNDGKSDVVVNVSASSSQVLVYRNTSSGGLISFAAPVDAAPLGSSPYYAVIPVDINNDGKLDLVVSSGSGNIMLLRNNSNPGAINIAYAAEYGVSNAVPRALAAADLDNDGKKDIVSTNAGNGSGNAISVFRNTSNGSTLSMAARVDYITNTDPYSIVLNDFDKDGKTDIGVANAGANSVTLLKNASVTGTLSFSAVATLVTNSFPEKMITADFNGDGYADIALVNSGNSGPAYDNRVSVYRNTSSAGSISFSAKTDFTTGSNPKGISAADLDGDGKADLAVSNMQSGTVSVFKNNSTGTAISFAARMEYGSGLTPYHTAAGDLDGDGYPEICYISLASTSFKILRSQINIGTVSLVPPVITSFSPVSGPVGTTVTITGTDFSTTPAENIVYFGSARASVLTASATRLTVSVPAGCSYKPITVTRDKLTAWSHAPFKLTFPDGGAPFTPDFFKPRFDSTTINEVVGMVSADFDGDGKVDYAVSNPNKVAVYKNLSTSTAMAFGPGLTIAGDASLEGLHTADINGDGKPDLISNTPGINVYINTTSGGVISFAAPVNMGVSFCQDISIGDLDLDGKPDIVYSGTGGNAIGVLRNTTVNATVSFFHSGYYIFGNARGFIAIGEISGDNKPDVTVVNEDGVVTVFRNTSTQGSITLTTGGTFSATGHPLDISLADIDNDGWRDLVIASNFDSTFSVLRNTSNGSVISFAPAVKFRSDLNPVYLGLGDFNGDTKVDVVVSNRLAPSVTVYKNNSTSGTIAFNTPARLATRLGPAAISVEDWNTDGLPDIGVASTESTPGIVSFYVNNNLFPVITSISPQNGIVGTTVTISGFNFSGATAVRFGGTNAASFSVLSGNTITAVTGEGSNGTVTVTTPVGTASYNSFSFAPPVISSFVPLSAAPGTAVTLSGSNFSVIAANNIVYFGAVRAAVTSASLTSLTVTVPPGATYEPITVTARNLTAYSPKPFIPSSGVSTGAFNSSSFGNRVDSLLPSPFVRTENPVARDFDGDGKPDIAIPVADSNLVMLFRNTSVTGAVSFAPRVNFGTGARPRFLASGDFDGDGKMDLAVANYNQQLVSVLRNTSVTGTISFGPKADFATADPEARNIAVQDFDGDGKPDLAVVTGFGVVEVMRNRSVPGTIDFAPGLILTNSGFPVFVSAGDLNNDGKPDLVISVNTLLRLLVIRNTSTPGNLSFTADAPVAVSGLPWGNALGDFDADGLLDIATSNEPVIGAGTMSVYKNNSTGSVLSFGLVNSYTGIYGIGGLGAGDLNGDGKPELIGVTQPGIPDSIGIFRNISTSGSVSFDTKVDFPVPDPINMLVCDMDADGKPDIVSSGAGISVLLNKTTLVTGVSTVSPAQLGIKVSPVPLHDNLSVYFGKNLRDVTIQLLSQQGVVLQSVTRGFAPAGSVVQLNTVAVPAGICYVRVISSTGQSTLKVVRL